MEGIILLGAKRDGYYKIKVSLSVPVVSIDTPFSAEDKDYVNVGLKDYEAAKEMTKYLLSMGHRKIAFFSLTEGGELLEKHYIDSERYRGYKDAMEEEGLSAGVWHNLSFTEEWRKKQYLSFYEEKFFHATALFVTADIMALEMMRFCMDRGISIPEQLSIAGFDGIKAGRCMHPMLTTMEQDSAEKGRKAVKELLSLLSAGACLLADAGEKQRVVSCKQEKENSRNKVSEVEGKYKNILLPAKLFFGETVAKI